LKAEEKHIRRAKKNNFKLEIEEENVSYKNSFGVRVQKIKIQKAFHKIHLIFLMFKSTLMIFKNVHQHINQILFHSFTRNFQT